MTTKMTRRAAAGVPRTAADKNAPLTADNTDISWASVRDYAKRSRARGDTVQEVVKVFEDLVRDAAPSSPKLAKRSCEVAEWAIQAYFEAPSSHVAAWRAESIGPRSPRRSGKSKQA
jgi:hypothetical protein